MTLRSSDLQSDSDLDSIRNSCDVFYLWIPVRWLHLFIVNGKHPALCPTRQVFVLDFAIFILPELAFDF